MPPCRSSAGIDASDFDWARGPMDLVAAARDGIQLFTHKATESTGITHVHYREALERARAAGIELLGAYHVVRSTDVAAQVRHFLGYLDSETPWWARHPGFFLQVDLELWDYDHVSAATGKAFVAELRRWTDKTVILYASRGQYGDSLDGIPVPLWNANYGSNAAGPYRGLYPGDASSRWAPYSGRAPMILQFGSKATIGTQPGCDINAFRGTYDQLKELIQGGDMPLTDDDARKVALAVWRTGLGPVIAANEVRKAAESWLLEGRDAAVDAVKAAGQAPVVLDAASLATLADALMEKLGPQIAAAAADEVAKRLGNG